MTALTKTLQILAALATLLGCNIYSYAPECGKFKRRQALQFVISLMHFIWIRPWMYLSMTLYSIFYIKHFLQILSLTANPNDYGLQMVYYISAIILRYQYIVVCVAFLYIYKHFKDEVQTMLNEFVLIYCESIRLNGNEPAINWWLFLVYVKESFIPAADMFSDYQISRLPYVGPESVISRFCSLSVVLFVCLQPFVLSMLVHLGLLLLHGCYKQQLQLRRCHSAAAHKELLHHYMALMKLRKSFEPFFRPFVWTALIADLTAFMLYFHIFLYDQHNIWHFLHTSVYTMIYPLCLLQQCLSISSIEKQFGSQLLRFRKNSTTQSQLQIFCLYKLVLFSARDRSHWNIFQYNRSHILECFYYSWVLSMFTNSLLVASPEAWIKHYNLTHS
ncbi:uncharacterized protein LOC132798950 [Drosophila nasuta]|uniref:uncharacterized protein LOC132798950 n=1 Tax=Drosophila nasuta TaxID=42062 RepID=UPI00295F32FF|nr:uncharacterized protein LOC132798950 [Drosophila nasuta]